MQVFGSIKKISKLELFDIFLDIIDRRKDNQGQECEKEGFYPSNWSNCVIDFPGKITILPNLALLFFLSLPNISPCDSNACLTCNSFISDQSFKSSLTGRIYKTQTYEQLTCGSSNVVYAIHCVRCGLMYVGETGRSLQSRINGHRAGIIKDGQSLPYKHFRLAGYSVADMKVQILEKIYHSSENPVNIRLHQRLRELHWIKELGTAAPYGCNDQIKGVGTLSSPSCKHTNVLGIFNKQQ